MDSCPTSAQSLLNRMFDLPACTLEMRVHMFGVLARLRIHLLTHVLTCSCAQLVGCLAYSYAYMLVCLACSRACVLTCLAYLCAYVHDIHACLCSCVLHFLACLQFFKQMLGLILHFRVLHASMLAYLAWFLCWNVLCAYMLACLMCLFGLFSLHVNS